MLIGTAMPHFVLGFDEDLQNASVVCVAGNICISQCFLALINL